MAQVLARGWGWKRTAFSAPAAHGRVAMVLFPCMRTIILTYSPIFRLGSGAPATTAGPLDNPRAQDALLAAPPDAAPVPSSPGTPRVVSPETSGSKDSSLQGADGSLVTLPSEPTWFRLNYVHPREERRLSSTWKRLAAGPRALLRLRTPTISPHLVRLPYECAAL